MDPRIGIRAKKFHGSATTLDPMLVCTALQADHEDLIHDVAYDFYGKRMATCSSDQTVKVRVLLQRVEKASIIHFPARMNWSSCSMSKKRQITVADPGFGAFWTPGSGMGKKIKVRGSG